MIGTQWPLPLTSAHSASPTATRNSGTATEYRGWGAEDGDYRIVAAFWYAEDSGGDWSNQARTDGFLGHFGSLFGSPGMRLTRGPTVATVLGDVETTEFDIDFPTHSDPPRQCIGFRTFWERYRQSYTRTLDFYACVRDGRMAEDQFVELLRGLSIEGEFEALVTDQTP